MAGLMRYGFVQSVSYGTNASGILTSFRDQFSTIPGWAVHDDQISSGSPSLVFKVTTSEGVGNEMYVRFWYVNTSYIPVTVYESWNNSTHTGSANFIGSGRIELSAQIQFRYYWAGDEDHILIGLMSDMPDQARQAPCYIGLTTKMRPDIDTTPKGWILLNAVYYDNNSTTEADGNASYSNFNRCPYMRSYNNTYRKVAHIYGTYPTWRGRYYDQEMPGGVYVYRPDGLTDKRTFWGRYMLVEDASGGFGPRGWVKSVLYSGNTYYMDIPNEARINVGGRDYVVYKQIPTWGDSTWSQYNPWGTYFGQTGMQHTWLIPTSDWHTACYVEGS